MVARIPSVEEQRDNLQVGIYLAANPYGVRIERVIEVALGYDVDAPAYPYEAYERRFKRAQAVGRDKFKARAPGYFTFNAVPFGRIFLYKALWYVWVNPQTGEAQTVPLLAGDLVPMQRARDKDLSTRRNTARSIRAASNIEEQRRAIQRGDVRTLQAIQDSMAEDESLGEILTGLHGIPYAEIQEILPQLPEQTFGSLTLSFQQTAREIKRYQKRLRQAQARVNRELMNWVMLQTGLPRNYQELALQDAADRLGRMGRRP